MFSFFKINDPYRLIAIFLIAFAIKIPFIINSCAFFEMHHWLIIGEAMNSGSMYDQIFDSLAPLAASTYWVLVSLFGRSILALQILGTLLMILQAIIFNNLTIQNKVFEQNTYFPAFIFIIISSANFGLSVLSPAQLGMTFILLAFSKLLAHVEFRAKRDEQIMNIGLLLGVAILFYIPYIVFLPIVLIILILFTNTLQRRYIILVISILIPFSIAFTYYWLVNGETGYFITNHIIPSLAIDFSFFTEIGIKITLFLPVILSIALGYISMPKQRRLNNYQTRLANLFFITGILTLLMFIFKDTQTNTAILLLVPVASFFASHLFFLIKRPLPDLLVSIIFVVFVLGISYDSEFAFAGITPKIEEKTTISPDLREVVEDKKIMILGNKPQIYEYGSLATPFYDWQLSTPVINDLQYYDNLVFIRESIVKNQPDIVLDYEFTWRKITNHIPELKKEYKQIAPFVWQKTN